MFSVLKFDRPIKKYQIHPQHKVQAILKGFEFKEIYIN